MTVKRILLSILTIIVFIPVIFSLVGSFQEPQIQANLQLYQTNLILQASELREQKFTEAREALLGNKPIEIAQQQYQEARKAIHRTIETLTQTQTKLDSGQQIATQDEQNSFIKNSVSPQLIETQKAIEENQKLQDEVDLKLGIIELNLYQITQGIDRWNQLIQQTDTNSTIRSLAQTLKGLYDEPMQISATAETEINNQLDGWFRYQALQQLYQLQNRQTDLETLEKSEQQQATQALIKLVFVGTIPILGGIIGIVLLIGLFIQLFLKKDTSILAINHSLAWDTPWNLETLWQVLIVGFFFVGQILIPLLLSLLQLDTANFSLREKAIYVLITYSLMTAGGLSVLYLSIKSFFPLPKEWFRFKITGKGIFWGVGGYLVALPLVVLISLINQQIWQGQGGSNPLLFLALEAQDWVVLAIFFVTATVAAPFFEEIMFRGFLLPSLTRYIPVWAAIGISGLIFAVAHLSLSEILPLFVLGIVLGTVYTRSRNLLSSMLLHGLWNGGTLLSLFILGSGSS